MPKTKSQNPKSHTSKYEGRAFPTKSYGKQNGGPSSSCSTCGDPSCPTTAKKIERGIIITSVIVAILGLLASVIDVFRAMMLFSAV